ncbi:DUF2007 domain-containing protein [Idiomarina loihiensis]|uniref:putative signal transducing protein n=1 Tax=Idiomarina loihiensis TaxID=135577 RepID=UPI00384B9D35
MKLIYTHENKLLVENARNLLQMEGIETVMKNEFSSGAAGDLAPLDTWPELWLVEDTQLAVAKTLIENMEEQANGADWVCNNCQEINGAAFEVCWNCGSPA